MRSLGLQVAQAWGVRRADGGYTPCVLQLIQLQIFVVVQRALCGYGLGLELGGSRVVVADPSVYNLT